MAISQVRAKVNGTWYTLTYDSASGAYKATVTAPGATSYHQSGGYYNVEVEATNTAGTKGTADGSSLPGLRLVVKERVAPVITIKLNGVDQGAVTVSGGSFSKTLTLAEGSNTIVVTATDAAGKSSRVTRTITLDTSVPAIQSASITPNPVDAGATMVISVVIA